MTFPGRKASTAAIFGLVLLLGPSAASAKFRPGVVGTRAPGWAETTGGRALQVGIVLASLAILIRVLRPEEGRRTSLLDADDATSPENMKEFWNASGGPGTTPPAPGASPPAPPRPPGSFKDRTE